MPCVAEQGQDALHLVVEAMGGPTDLRGLRKQAYVIYKLYRMSIDGCPFIISPIRYIWDHIGVII